MLYSFLYHIFMSVACALAVACVRQSFSHFNQSFGINGHKINVSDAIVFFNKRSDLLDVVIACRHVPDLDVNVHNDSARKLLQYLLKGGQTQIFILFAEFHAKIKLFQLGKSVIPDVADTVGNSFKIGIVGGEQLAVTCCPEVKFDLLRAIATAAPNAGMVFSGATVLNPLWAQSLG